MNITSIKRIGKSERYKVYYDSSFITLEGETILKNLIKVGEELPEEKLFEIQYQSEKITAFDRAIDYLARGLKTKKQIRDYLFSKGYCKNVYDYVISKLEEYKYIDDKMYADNYLKTYMACKGKRLLKFELSQKGVANEDISELFNETDDIIDEYQSALNLAKKKVKNLKDFDIKSEQKLYRYLASKGFACEDIIKVIKEIKKGEIDGEDWN